MAFYPNGEEWFYFSDPGVNERAYSWEDWRRVYYSGLHQPPVVTTAVNLPAVTSLGVNATMIASRQCNSVAAEAAMEVQVRRFQQHRDMLEQQLENQSLELARKRLELEKVMEETVKGILASAHTEGQMTVVEESGVPGKVIPVNEWMEQMVGRMRDISSAQPGRVAEMSTSFQHASSSTSTLTTTGATHFDSTDFTLPPSPPHPWGSPLGSYHSIPPVPMHVPPAANPKYSLPVVGSFSSCSVDCTPGTESISGKVSRHAMSAWSAAPTVPSSLGRSMYNSGLSSSASPVDQPSCSTGTWLADKSVSSTGGTSNLCEDLQGGALVQSSTVCTGDKPVSSQVSAMELPAISGNLEDGSLFYGVTVNSTSAGSVSATATWTAIGEREKDEHMDSVLPKVEMLSEVKPKVTATSQVSTREIPLFSGHPDDRPLLNGAHVNSTLACGSSPIAKTESTGTAEVEGKGGKERNFWDVHLESEPPKKETTSEMKPTSTAVCPACDEGTREICDGMIIKELSGAKGSANDCGQRRRRLPHRGSSAEQKSMSTVSVEKKGVEQMSVDGLIDGSSLTLLDHAKPGLLSIDDGTVVPLYSKWTSNEAQQEPMSQHVVVERVGFDEYNRLKTALKWFNGSTPVQKSSKSCFETGMSRGETIEAEVVRSLKKPDRIKLVWDEVVSIGSNPLDSLPFKCPGIPSSSLANLYGFREHAGTVGGDWRHMLQHFQFHREDSFSQYPILWGNAWQPKKQQSMMVSRCADTEGEKLGALWLQVKDVTTGENEGVSEAIRLHWCRWSLLFKKVCPGRLPRCTDQMQFPYNFPIKIGHSKCFERMLRVDQDVPTSRRRKIAEYSASRYVHEPSRAEPQEADPARIWRMLLGVVRRSKKSGEVSNSWDSVSAVLCGFRLRRVEVCGDMNQMFHLSMIRRAHTLRQRYGDWFFQAKGFRRSQIIRFERFSKWNRWRQTVEHIHRLVDSGGRQEQRQKCKTGCLEQGELTKPKNFTRHSGEVTLKVEQCNGLSGGRIVSRVSGRDGWIWRAYGQTVGDERHRKPASNLAVLDVEFEVTRSFEWGRMQRVTAGGVFRILAALPDKIVLHPPRSVTAIRRFDPSGDTVSRGIVVSAGRMTGGKHSRRN